MEPYDAVVLGGGRSSRAGGDKLALVRDGRPLLAYAVDAVASAARVVIVGPEAAGLPRSVLWRRDDPPYAGPVAAIAAALPDLTADVVVVLAGDLASPGAAVPVLVTALTHGVDAAVLLDGDGVRQPLLAAYRAGWLRARVAVGRAAARSLLDGARLVEIPDTWGAARDVDTRGDAAELGFTEQP